jgi:hypothetical protein
MLRDIVEARAVGGHRLFLRFNDGQSGELDLGRRLGFKGVFAPLKDPREFAKVFVHPEFHTVTWPNEADLDSDVLYSLVTGAPLPGGGEMPAWAKPATPKTPARRAAAKARPRRVMPAAKSRKTPTRRARAG